MNTPSALELARASALTAGKLQTNNLDRKPAAAQLAELQLALAHYKNKLTIALDSHDRAATDTILNQLIALRGTQTALRLQHRREHGILISKDIIHTERARFYEDCTRLIAACAT